MDDSNPTARKDARISAGDSPMPPLIDHHGPPGRHDADDLRVLRTVTLVLAIAFLGAGIVGFLITGFDGFADHHTGDHLLWFEVNGLHNTVHLLFGIVGLASWRTLRGVRAFGLLVAVGYLGALIYGVIAADETWDILSINEADNWLHVLFIVVGAGLALGASTPARPGAGPASDGRTDAPSTRPHETSLR